MLRGAGRAWLRVSLRALPLVAVLMFHAIGPPGPYTISPAKFRDSLAMLRAQRVEVLSLSQFEQYELGRLHLRRPGVLLTFDDGSRSAYTLATPILRRFHDHAVAFLIGHRIGRDPQSLTPAQVRAMAATGLWAFGSHTYNLHSGYGERQNLHYYAAHRLSARRVLARDIALEDATFRRLGLPRPNAFAFPFGFYTRADVRQLHQSFAFLFTSNTGFAMPGESTIPRINIGSDFAGVLRLTRVLAVMDSGRTTARRQPSGPSTRHRPRGASVGVIL